MRARRRHRPVAWSGGRRTAADRSGLGRVRRVARRTSSARRRWRSMPPRCRACSTTIPTLLAACSTTTVSNRTTGWNPDDGVELDDGTSSKLGFTRCRSSRRHRRLLPHLRRGRCCPRACRRTPGWTGGAVAPAWATRALANEAAADRQHRGALHHPAPIPRPARVWLDLELMDHVSSATACLGSTTCDPARRFVTRARRRLFILYRSMRRTVCSGRSATGKQQQYGAAHAARTTAAMIGTAPGPPPVAGSRPLIAVARRRRLAARADTARGGRAGRGPGRRPSPARPSCGSRLHGRGGRRRGGRGQGLDGGPPPPSWRRGTGGSPAARRRNAAAAAPTQPAGGVDERPSVASGRSLCAMMAGRRRSCRPRRTPPRGWR